jgi:hypothetical protein
MRCCPARGFENIIISPRGFPPGANTTILGFQLDKTKLPEAKS